MIYKISAMVKGEKITQEYHPSTSRHQAKKAFRLLYPTARRLVVEEVRQKEEAAKRAKEVAVERSRRQSNRLEKELESQARTRQVQPYYH